MGKILFQFKIFILLFFSRNPNPSSDLSLPSWPVATSVPFDYLIIGNENGLYENVRLHRVAKGLHVDRANFWQKLKEDHQLSRWSGGGILKASIVLLFLLSSLIFAL